MSNNEAYVDFSKFLESSQIQNTVKSELREVQSSLNLKPVEKKNGKWIPSSINVAVMQHAELTVRLIKAMVESGLSYNNGDYYVFVRYGKPAITKSPNGLIKAINKLASKSGYFVNINTGCIFSGYKEFFVKRNGIVDELHLINDETEAIMGDTIENTFSDIVAPYAVGTLIDRESGKTISSKVIIVRHNEYKNALQQSTNLSTHEKYPVPMATKIALKRLAEEIGAMLGIDDSVELATLKQEVADHNKDYDLNKKVKEPESKTISKEDVAWIEKTIKEKGIEKEVMSWLEKKQCNSIEEVNEKVFKLLKKKLDGEK